MNRLIGIEIFIKIYWGVFIFKGLETNTKIFECIVSSSFKIFSEWNNGFDGVVNS